LAASAPRQPRLEFYADSKPIVNLTLKIAALEETVTVSQEAPGPR